MLNKEAYCASGGSCIMGDLILKYLKVNIKWKQINQELEEDLTVHQVFRY